MNYVSVHKIYSLTLLSLKYLVYLFPAECGPMGDINEDWRHETNFQNQVEVDVSGRSLAGQGKNLHFNHPWHRHSSQLHSHV